MLKYSVKPSKDTELRTFPIRELFVSPDLSYISGTTDILVGLVNGEQIVIKSPYLIGSEVNTINVETVKRQGIVETFIKLPVKTITMPLNFPIYSDKSGNCYILENNSKNYLEDAVGDFVLKNITQKYVEYRGDICYFFHGTPSGYLIDHKFYATSFDDEFVTIKTYMFIEDGELKVGDYTYYADFSKIDNETAPTLRLSKKHRPVETGDLIGLIDGCECFIGEIKDYMPSKWNRVSKFYIQKKENPSFNIDDALYGGYKHYVTFNGENYYLRDVYQYDEEEEKDVYLGYGIQLNGMFYDGESNYGDSIYNDYHDMPFAGSILYVGEYDEYLDIYDTLISPITGGCFVILMCSDEGSDVIPGNFLIAESNSPITITRMVETDEEENNYFIFEGKKYLVENKLADTINISGEDYLLTYLNDDYTSASTIINGETMYFDVDGTKAKLSNKIYYKKTSEDDEVIKINYGINENEYDITENSGVTINGHVYPVAVSDEENTDGDFFVSVTITENIKLTLEVTEKNGSSMYLAYPVVDDYTIDEYEKNMLQREYSSIIVNNWKSFSFILRKDTFGKRPLTVENGLMDSMSSMLPYSISDAYLLENKIEILRLQNYLSFNFPLSYKTANNLRREDIIKHDFVDYIKDQTVNTVVDMEKDIYYPVYVYKNGETEEFRPIQQLRFNLHFRTRNFENWKKYEDDREFKDVVTPNYLMSNWFVTDLNYYKNLSTDSKKKLHNSSDLLGLMNFTTNEIKNQATKIGKSFLRLSFYSTDNPKTQVLLATSTIFLDKNLAYKKYITSKRNSDLIFIDTKVMQEAGYTAVTDYINAVNSNTDEFQVSSNTISDSSEVYMDNFFNDDTRLSSRLVVNDKYNTDTSSEGYYIYMFKDYAKKMRETTIYMKVDFNHAGIGQTMSFMLPRQIGNGEDVGEPLYIHGNKIETLKNGFKLSDIYKQTHIPIRVKYDDKTNKYVYYLPDGLRENSELSVPDEIMEFNLFEVKFANESIVGNVS